MPPLVVLLRTEYQVPVDAHAHVEVVQLCLHEAQLPVAMDAMGNAADTVAVHPPQVLASVDDRHAVRPEVLVKNRTKASCANCRRARTANL